MLTLTIPGTEYFNDEDSKFVTVNDTRLVLEHSLVSLSKWEAKYNKPFLGNEDKTTEETVGYIEAMVLTPEIPPEVFSRFTSQNVADIEKYIDKSMTATTFTQTQQRPGREIITAELIYHWMIAFTIPVECENWHLNRLLTLIRVCHVKSEKPKKMSASEAAQQRADLNAKRRAASGSSG